MSNIDDAIKRAIEAGESVIPIDSLDEFFAWQQVNNAKANEALCDEQKSVGWGSTWVRFWMHGDGLVVIFGKVVDEAYYDNKINAATDDEERQEWEWEHDSVAAAIDEGLLFGKAYSVIEPEGEWGSTHRFNLWPIDEAVFTAAQNANWVPHDLRGSAEGDQLEAAYHGYRRWILARAGIDG